MSVPALNEDWVRQLIKEYRPFTKQGNVADYIPELAYANPHSLGLAIAAADGSLWTGGDCETKFTLQSISKVITFMIALLDHGPERVFTKVGMEPSVDPFNSIVKLEDLDHRKPLNPMINAGAIAIASMLQGDTIDERLQRVCGVISAIAGCKTVEVNEKIYLSEKATGDRNRALAYFMKSTGIIDADVSVEDTLDLYFRLCSLEVNCIDLARIGLFFAQWGETSVPLSPVETCGRQSLVPANIVQIVTTIMITSGMYNHSGEFFLKVGLPAKSGVSGGIVAFAPNQYGFGIFGPAIDAAGNSVAGVKLLERLSRDLRLHLVSP